MCRPRECAFKQFKCPRTQCVKKDSAPWSKQVRERDRHGEKEKTMVEVGALGAISLLVQRGEGKTGNVPVPKVPQTVPGRPFLQCRLEAW